MIEKKLKDLKEIISSMKSVIIAFSGGVDSSFLASVAFEVLGDKAIAVTSDSTVYPRQEIQEAKKIAKEIGINHKIFSSEELNIPEFSDNPPERCYHCKKELFSKLWEIARGKGYKNVADGTNYDDLDDFRPGLKAGTELNVSSPLMEAKLTKNEIRKLLKDRGLRTWNKSSQACLASRFPYGSQITPEKLLVVEEAEQYLQKLGLEQLRVRHHDNIARIEVCPKDMKLFIKKSTREKIVNKFKQLGYTYTTLDLRGYLTGSMNELL